MYKSSVTQSLSYDSVVDAEKGVVQNPPWSRQTPGEPLTTAFDLVSTWEDFGGEIIMSGRKAITLFLNITEGSSANIRFMMWARAVSDGTNHSIPIDQLSVCDTTNQWVAGYDGTEDNAYLEHVAATGGAKALYIELQNAVPYILFQAKDNADGDGTVDAYICRGY